MDKTVDDIVKVKDDLVKARGRSKASITRLENWFKENEKSNISKNELIFRKDYLSKVFDKYLEVQNELETIDDEFSVDMADVEDRFLTLGSALKNKIDTISVNSVVCTSAQQNHSNNHHIRLPEIKIPHFDGNIANWPSFIEMFTKLIVDDLNLSDIEKLIYLKSILKNEPLQLIENLEVNNSVPNAIPQGLPDTQNLPGPSNISSHSVYSNNLQILLATALVTVYDVENNPISVRCLTDSGSQVSFITDRLAKRICYSPYTRNLQISGIAQTSSVSNKMVDLKIYSNTYPGKNFNLSCAVLESITCQHPQVALDLNLLKIPKNIKLADPHFCTPSDVDMLLGADIYFDLVTYGLIKLGPNLPILQNTHLGYIVGGNIPYSRYTMLGSNATRSKNNAHSHYSNISLHVQTADLDSLLKNFWEIEETKPLTSIHAKTITPSEQRAEDIFKSSLTILPRGRFQVDLPLKTPNEYQKLGESFHLAKRRFFNLEKRLNKSDELRHLHTEFISEYVSLGHCKYVPLSKFNELSEHKFFLPHHCVFKHDSLTTRLRVVFDGSMKSTSNVSLNDIMLKGYTVQPDLFEILIRFRLYKYTLIADIEKMFRQIKINPKQTFLLNILWRNSPQEELKCLELQTATYGTNSASFLSTRCLKELAVRNKEKYPLAADTLENSCYVDDILHGANDIETLYKTYKQLSTSLNSAGIPLHKWSSNSSEFLDSISSESQKSNYVIKPDNWSNKALGICWNSQSDMFFISLPDISSEPKYTKREVLSIISSIFDPLGLINPITVSAKLLMQKIWICNLNWDDKLTGEISSEWLNFLAHIPDLAKLTISRPLLNPLNISRIEIHGFCDANASDLIRLGGRLRNANVSYNQKFPLLLPTKCQVARSLLEREHIRLLHTGPQNTLSNIRLTYWPLDGLREIKRIIYKCKNCYRFNARPAHQIMADLPKERFQVSRPFTNVGIDYGGPFQIKSSKLRRAPICKAYIAVFVCLVTKAVHIELVSSLSTEAFLLTVKRFISRRGIPKTIYSDNASNFLGARNQLKELYDFFMGTDVLPTIKELAASTLIEWKFIAPRSPHHGGIWEAAIKSCKYHLVRMMGNNIFTFEELTTILAQIEAVLNSRPLCPLSDSQTDFSFLTPAHFLIGSSMTSYSEKDISTKSENSLSLWQKCSKIQQHFWKCWSRDYLNRLQNKPKWFLPQENIKVDDLVLLIDDNAPPLKWPLARVIETLPGKDGRVRTVKLRTKDGTFIRSVVKVCPLPHTHLDLTKQSTTENSNINVRRKIKVFPMAQFCTSDVTADKVKSRWEKGKNKELILASVYLPSDAVTLLPTKEMKDLVNHCLSQTVIDIMLATAKISNKSQNWQVSEDISMSDHRTYNISVEKSLTKSRDFRRTDVELNKRLLKDALHNEKTLTQETTTELVRLSEYEMKRPLSVKELQAILEDDSDLDKADEIDAVYIDVS
ncbi:uncharacterized protein [Diabrotica undecimpunctata]|uniref:uncharacterized protein n=1 Tax=Diabrotica undecimpunctata TaxID=50387 RepID=UPI003B6338FB